MARGIYRTVLQGIRRRNLDMSNFHFLFGPEELPLQPEASLTLACDKVRGSLSSQGGAWFGSPLGPQFVLHYIVTDQLYSVRVSSLDIVSRAIICSPGPLLLVTC
jgi:hypothetical protein